ncbi:hypothetical protein AB0T83_00455 [Fluviibacterium sp. DFM31]|uniref:Cytochrome C oxidase assembly protein n=1 Tax=Meridianimarinicoccus marinus TaxID=3231483 RepID=A0ABV3L131_9RHOB
MALGREHELHTRRRGRNLGLGLTLLAFVAVVFGLTLAKIGGGGGMQAFDHAPRSELVPETGK